VGSALLPPHPGDFSSALAHLPIASGLIRLFLGIKEKKLIIHSCLCLEQICEPKLKSKILKLWLAN